MSDGELFAEVTAPKGGTFAAKRKGRETEPADPQAVKWVSDGNPHYVPAPIKKELKAALEKAARQEGFKVSYINGVIGKENVVQILGKKKDDEAADATATEPAQAEAA